MSQRILKVYLHTSYIGDLIEENGKKLSFQYDTSAKNALSLSMPIRNEVYTDDIVRPYFENLLPEGDILKLIAITYGVSNTNPFSLLKVIGEDCAGAVHLLTKDTTIPENMPKMLSDIEFQNIIVNNASSTPYYQRGMRLSLAGAQNKITLIFSNNHFYIPNFNFPSSHIIKFDNPTYPSLLINEMFCTNLARELKLPISDIYYEVLASTPYLLIERYDREKENGKMKRIHQEDFCQILSIRTSNKYQQEGGPNFLDIVNALNKYSSFPARELVLLAKISIFNYLIGNCDYHAKNLSILHKNNYFQLSPFYDLVSTMIVSDLDTGMAMSINKKHEISTITSKDFIKEFNMWGLNGKNILKLVLNDFKHIRELAAKLKLTNVYEAHDESIRLILQFIDKQWNKLVVD